MSHGESTFVWVGVFKHIFMKNGGRGCGICWNNNIGVIRYLETVLFRAESFRLSAGGLLAAFLPLLDGAPGCTLSKALVCVSISVETITLN